MMKTVGCGACAAAAMCVLACGSSSLPTEPTSQRATSAPAGLVFGNPTTGQNLVVSIPASFTIRTTAQTAIRACIGENVAFSHDSLMVARAATLPNGSVSLTLVHFSGQGAAAVAESSGTAYHLSGPDSSAILQAPGPLAATVDADLQAIGPDGAVKFTSHAVEQFTMSPDGSVAAAIDVASVACA